MTVCPHDRIEAGAGSPDERDGIVLEGILFGSLYRDFLLAMYGDIMKRFSLQKIDLVILLFLAHHRQWNTARDIAKMKMFTKGHISQSLTRLLDLGYIRIEQDGRDRRVSHNLLTEEASEVVEASMAMWKQVHERIFRGFSEEEKDAFVRCTRLLHGNMVEEIRLRKGK